MINEFVDVRARGIPCTARIDYLKVVPPWKGSCKTCPSDLDYHGYTDLEFTICDSNGREAPWIDEKMTDDDYKDVEDQIRNEYFRCYS